MHMHDVGGFEDDRDEGEWLLYTGSGGKDLSGNKRTNKVQSADQVFEGGNQALVQSCIDGLPVRVLRSHKEKGSCYAPEKTDPTQSIRYDGIYKIVAAWRSVGKQGVFPSISILLLLINPLVRLLLSYCRSTMLWRQFIHMHR
jgi:SAD/SRA domain